MARDDFDSVKAASAKLLACLAIDEKFSMIVRNYEEIERLLLTEALHAMLYDRDRFGQYEALHLEFNRLLGNALSSIRHYQDATPGVIAEITGDSEDKSRAKALFCEQYDSRVGFHAASRLRNFVQHAAYPNFTFVTASRREPPVDCLGKELGRLPVRIRVLLDSRQLAAHSKFKVEKWPQVLLGRV